MAGTSLFALLDDIAALLDDVAVMSKVAAKKTAGVLGDDLALNAQQVAGVAAERELPVVWAVARGSFKNKLILVPAALLISAFLPQAVTPLLMLGGAFLCFEGAEKIAHRLFHPAAVAHEHAEHIAAATQAEVNLIDFERDKIRGAVRTDFILSAEIIVIALGTVAAQPFSKQFAVLATVAIVMTIGVYGLVAGIVKLDDAGLHLSSRKTAGWAGRLIRALGRGLLAAAPRLMKGLSVAGTAAMFLVGGSILLHGLPGAADLAHAIQHALEPVPGVGGLLATVGSMLLDALTGLAAGALIVLGVEGAKKLKPSAKA